MGHGTGCSALFFANIIFVDRENFCTIRANGKVLSGGFVQKCGNGRNVNVFKKCKRNLFFTFRTIYKVGIAVLFCYELFLGFNRHVLDLRKLINHILLFFYALVKPDKTFVRGDFTKIKKLVSVLLIFAITFLFCACNSNSEINDETIYFGNDNIGNDLNGNDGFLDISKEFRGVWFSYLELKAAPKSSKKEFSSYLEKRFEQLKELSVNCVFVQVRPFADAIYKSEIFPSSSCVVKNRGDRLPFDFLKVIIDIAKKFSLSVHAWINPYRILLKGENEEVLLKGGNEKTLSYPDTVSVSEGLFFSPASTKAQKIVISGVREILENYDVDGIHIDDYFYPTTDEEIDKTQFEDYKKSGGTMSLSNWRRENVNALVRGIYTAVKECSNKKIFSISPAGNIEKNRNVYFADVERWGSEDGYCDVLIPQIYFGFENGHLPFESCAKQWRKIVTNKNVSLCAGLALYKVGKEDLNAGSGKDEWKNENDIISRQVEFLRGENYAGFCLYSLQFVNFNEKLLANELKSLKDVI